MTSRDLFYNSTTPAAASAQVQRRVAVAAAVVFVVSSIGFGQFGRTPAANAVTATTKKSTKTTLKSSKTTLKSTKTTVKSTKASVTKSSTTAGSPSSTKATAATDGATTTANVRPVTESTTTIKANASTTVPPKIVKGTVFIPGAGKVLDLGANEVAKLAAGGRVEADVRGASGLAASGTGTVILDVTITNPAAPGRVTLVPVAPEFARSVVQSSVAFPAGATTVSRVAVPVGASGMVRVATTAGPSGLAVTVVGWVLSTTSSTAEPSAIALESCRILDTVSGLGGLQGEITPARPFDLPAVGIAKVPAALTTTGPTPAAVVLSVSAAQATGPLELRVVPTGGESPELKLFMQPGQSTTANFVVPVGSDARAAFYVNAAGTQITVDVVGWLDRDNVAKPAGPC